MGRRKNSVVQCSETTSTVKYDNQDVELMYPTLKKVTNSNEMHMFDLASIQAELECALTSVMERMMCLLAESKGKDLPPQILGVLNPQEPKMESEQQSSLGRSLTVKANPDKPLTLIISQRGRPSQQPQKQEVYQPLQPAPDPQGPARSKPPIYGRRSSRSSIEEATGQCSSPSSDKNQLTASYAIPNKFWELMEPYCAEITEANIGYLEGLIRSYQHMESTYFQFPISLRSCETKKTEYPESPVMKRPRRDLTPISVQAGNSTEQTATNGVTAALYSASNMTLLANYLENELRKHSNESSTLGKLSESLLDSSYRENVLFSFTDSISRIGEEATAADSLSNRADNKNAEHSDATEGPVDGATSPNDAAPTGEKEKRLSDSFLLPPALKQMVTSKASLPLKNLAKQLHVSSSFRVEKKISQAMDELGLFPLTMVHPATPQVIHKPAGLFKTTRSSNNCNTILHPKPVANGISTRANKVEVKTSHLKISISRNSRCPSAKSLRIANVRRRRMVKSYQENSETDESEVLMQKTPVKEEDITAKSPTPLSLKKLRAEAYKRKLRNSMNSPVSNALQNGYDGLRDGLCLNHVNPALSSPKQMNEMNGILVTDDDVPGKEDEDWHSSGCRARGVRPGYLTPPDSLKKARYNDCLSPTLTNQRCICNTPLPPDITLDGENRLSPLTKIESPEQPIQLMNGDAFSFDHLPSENEQTTLGERNFELKEDGNHLNSGDPKNSLIGVASPGCGHIEHDPDTKPILLSNCEVSCEHHDRAALLNAKVEDGYRSPHEPIPESAPINKDAASLEAQLFDSNSASGFGLDEVGWAIVQRQHELRILCAANHNVLRRLVQAARRDMQRQEIQRRLAIADADVIEAYNKLESYRPQRKPPLKRDRDAAYKALKERRKIQKELEAFDLKSP
ncbi:unnamed protein product [Calicophoron daubneyi]|uniref:Transcriptional adapter 3 n=1 Tax=Calicophoron daubneyi TaxID=300641 RepID=A0AAV2T895_CALDB